MLKIRSSAYEISNFYYVNDIAYLHANMGPEGSFVIRNKNRSKYIIYYIAAAK